VSFTRYARHGNNAGSLFFFFGVKEKMSIDWRITDDAKVSLSNRWLGVFVRSIMSRLPENEIGESHFSFAFPQNEMNNNGNYVQGPDVYCT